MPATHRNRLVTALSAAPSPATTGPLQIGTAASGYRTFGAGDNGKFFDVSIVDGTAWEIRTGCVYTHAGTSLARGTLEDSSTGADVALTSAAVVTVTMSAGMGQRIESAALTQVTGTDANTTMVVGNLYVVDMSAWATADRTYTLPAVAAVGDRVSVMVYAGDASHELIITAASGDSLSGIAGGTEWSRVFITGEVVTMRCVTANAAWIVEYDGRIPQKAALRLSTSATSTETAATFARPTAYSGAWTADVDIGSLTSTANGEIKVRRAGLYNIAFQGLTVAAATNTKYTGVALFKNGTASLMSAATNTSSGTNGAQNSNGALNAYSLAADDYIVYQFRSEMGSSGLASSALPRYISGMSLTEVF